VIFLTGEFFIPKILLVISRAVLNELAAGFTLTSETEL